jgi:hypothetical protein
MVLGYGLDAWNQIPYGTEVFLRLALKPIWLPLSHWELERLSQQLTSQRLSVSKVKKDLSCTSTPLYVILGVVLN